MLPPSRAISTNLAAGVKPQPYEESRFPSAYTLVEERSSWTKAQPYGKELLPPKIVPSADPGRTEGVMMLGAKRVVLAPSAYTLVDQCCGWTKAQPYEGIHFPPPTALLTNLAAGVKPQPYEESRFPSAYNLVEEPQPYEGRHFSRQRDYREQTRLARSV